MSYRLKCAAVAFFFFYAGAAYAPLRAGLMSEDIYANVLPSTITLEVENMAGERFVGSAFLALSDGLIVTAWHVVHDARKVVARFADHRLIRVIGLVDKDPSQDLALLKLETHARPILSLSRTPPRIGSRVYVIGAPKGFDFSITDGLISQIRTIDGVRYYQISCPISAGDSGGAVLNDQGEAIGVISWRKANAENVSFAIPSTEIARLNPARLPAPWQTQLAIVNRARPEPRPPIGSQPTALPEAEVTQDFSSFQRFLAERVGKPVTVTTVENGKEQRFLFEVPPMATK